MSLTGIADLPLHDGWVPRWLFSRMVKLARALVSAVISEYGGEELVSRLADPFWFQALGCVLGFDWHSSGLTTVVTAALREAVSPTEHRVAVCGGKGKASLRAPSEIEEACREMRVEHLTGELTRASRLAAKVDNACVQDGYQLYHHAFVFTESGLWAVVQQGMSPADRTARRYHWLSAKVRSFTDEPHTAIVAERVRSRVLDMTAHESEGARKASLDLVKEGPRRLARLIDEAAKGQKTLLRWIPAGSSEVSYLKMPWSINWRALEEAYQLQPSRYEELVEIRGVGPATVRGLALIAELIYGERASWRDPARFSFAFGGKDGVPFPVDRKALDEAIEFLTTALERADVRGREKLDALKRLRRLAATYTV
ncbi:MAG: DUF763 domain-containing protein [Thermoproteota archaeon]|nr:MAG: DUF763 domain-containing protein [Candidatus Korarchaeota archaeon]